MCCVTSVLHFHTLLLFCYTRAQIMTATFWSTLYKCVVHTSWNVIRYCSFSFISFICQKNTVIQYKSLHQGCCLRKFFGPKEVRSPSNISRCPFKKKNSCNLVKRATTGALKHHWSTGESAKEKCFQYTCTCRFKKRYLVAALCKLKHFGPWSLIPKSLIFVWAGNNAESIRISSNIGMNLICH